MIEIKNLVKTYHPKKGVPVNAVNNINLKIEETGLVFILGKSGSGKSTLLNLLGGLDKYDNGDIIIKGKSTRDFSQSNFDSYRNTFVGFIFQEYNILDDFSVGANIALAIELQGRKASEHEVNKILDILDLKGFANRRPNELSGGQKQRIAIARALVKEPDIILADEPSGALDSETGKQIFETLKRLSKDKLVLVVSHDRETAEIYGDRIIELADGNIINDIKKVSGTNNNKANLILDKDDGLIVKEGYKLTESDLAMINSYLEEHKKLNIVSKKKLDSKNSDDQEHFVKTENNLSIKDYPEEFKMIKSKLPFKMAFKMGASGLNHKKFRLLFTIILSLVAFTLFAVADSMAAYNKEDATINSIMDGKVSNASFTKQWEGEVDYGDYSYIEKLTINLNDEDINKLNQDLQGTYKGVYNKFINEYESINFSSSLLENTQSIYYTATTPGFIEYSNNELSELGFTIVGNLPTNDNEIAITDYIFEHFKTYGYNDNIETINASNINNPNDIIGKTINLKSWSINLDDNFTITGIVDTKFNNSRYEDLKQPSNQMDMMFLTQEFMTVIEYSHHALLFANNGYIKRQLDELNPNVIKTGNDVRLSYFNLSNEYITGVDSVDKLSSFEQVAFFNKNKTTLSANEIIVSMDALNWYWLNGQEITYNGKSQNLRSHEEDIVSNLVDIYVAENFTEAETLFPDAQTDNELINSYNYYIRNEGYINNPYGKSYLDIKELAWDLEVLDLINTLNPLTARQSYSIGYLPEETRNITIVGVFPVLNNESDLLNRIILDDLFHTTIKDSVEKGPYKFAISKMPERRAEIRQIVEYSYEKSEENISYPLQNQTTPMLNLANNMVESLAKVFLYIGIGFAVFSALMLSNFIGTSVARKKREIGILRALGARSNDVFRIFFNESLLIALINFTLAGVASYFTVRLINTSLREQVGLQVTIFNFGVRQIGLLLAISVFVAIVASYIPVRGIARKRPVEAIRNR